MALFTVIGGQGFIGAEVCEKLISEGHDVFVPAKEESFLHRELGIVIYCAGHGDCLNNPLKVINSNTTTLAEVIKLGLFQKLIYFSSTRLYLNQKNSCEESDLSIISSDNRRLFNLTKLVSEELCLLSNKNIVVVRPSNVYGTALNSPLYLPSIVRNAINHSHVDMYVSKSYEKDYVSVSDVVNAIFYLALTDVLKHKVYNIASGINVSAKSIADILQKHTNCEIVWHDRDYTREDQFPVTNIQRLSNEMEYNPNFVLNDLPLMIKKFKKLLIT